MNNENDLQIIIEENWDNLSEGKTTEIYCSF